MLGEKIKTERLKKGLSQEAFADRLSVVRQTVSKWEKGLSVPDSKMLLKIAATLDTTPSYLLDEEVSALSTETEKASKPSVITIILIILGFPIWFPLLVAAFSVIISLYASIWPVIIALWSVFASLIASSFGILVVGGIFAFYKNPIIGIALIGAALILLGLSIFLFFGCKYATMGIVILTKKCALWILNLFVKPRGEK